MNTLVRNSMKDISLCCFSDDSMIVSKGNLIYSAKKLGFFNSDKIYHYCGYSVNENFYEKNRDILNQKRGCGYWLWKPYIILETLKKIPNNEYLLYLDSGTTILDDVSILKEVNSDVVLFHNEHNHIDWCKMDTLMHITPMFAIPDYKQLQASAMFLKNTVEVRNFIGEWLELCQIKRLIDDSPSVIPNAPSFKEHRHDQAILTCLDYKWGISKYLKWDDYITYDRNNFERKHPDKPILFWHHRKRNHEWENI